jgi:uncharacterized membrane protein YkoI
MSLSRLEFAKLAPLLALCLLLAGGQALADSRRDEGQRERREERQAQISPAQAAAIVERAYGGRVMNVQARQGRSGVIYSVKILQDSGHMRTVNVDGQTGAILN